MFWYQISLCFGGMTSILFLFHSSVNFNPYSRSFCRRFASLSVARPGARVLNTTQKYVVMVSNSFDSQEGNDNTNEIDNVPQTKILASPPVMLTNFAKSNFGRCTTITLAAIPKELWYTQSAARHILGW